MNKDGQIKRRMKDEKCSLPIPEEEEEGILDKPGRRVEVVETVVVAAAVFPGKSV